MKKVISFDLDGTIVDGRYGNAVWLEGVPQKFAEKYALSVETAKVWVKREYDSIGESHLLWYDIDYWLERFNLKVSVDELLDRYSDHIQLLPHVAEVIKALSEKYMLVIASNAARIFVEKELACTGLERYFSHVISATTDLRMVKKQEEFYRKLCSILDVAPEEVVHVGDHEVFDVEVPLQIGIESYHYNPGAPARNGRVIQDHRELLEKL
jgi:HAD superfamily hydrolase (TIGR01493 family)